MLSETQFPQAVQPLPATVGVLHHTLHYEHQLTPLYACRSIVFRYVRGTAEGARLQHLGVYHHTSRLPVQELDACTSFVHEDEHLTAVRVTLHHVGHYAAKCVETLAHVCRAVVVPVPEAVGKAKHDETMTVLWLPDAPGSCHPECASWCPWLSEVLCSAYRAVMDTGLTCRPCGRSWGCQMTGTESGSRLRRTSAEGTVLLPCHRAPVRHTCTLSHRTSTREYQVLPDDPCKCTRVPYNTISHPILLLC